MSIIQHTIDKHAPLKRMSRKRKKMKSLLKMFSCQEPTQNFFLGGGTDFRLFFSVVFFDRFILSNLRNKNDSRGVQGHATPENF